jgi:hypothetical protein
MSGWTVLLTLVPIVNLFISYRLLFTPRDYAITKQADTAQQVFSWLALFVIVSAIVGAMIAGS